jgi:hypothetical protein
METMYYIGLGVHKKTISYCMKDGRQKRIGTNPKGRFFS